jgi:hypothetical protein
MWFFGAFDKVPKERLLEKLMAHGVKGEVLKWIRNWLTDRRQRVVLKARHPPGQECYRESLRGVS